MLEEDAWDSMRRRADAFLKEVKRVIDIGMKNGTFLRPSIGLVGNVMYNFNKPILQCSATFYDSEVEFLGSPFGKPECTHYIVFEPIGEGGESVRRRLHPASGGPGSIAKGARKRVVKKLVEFIQKVNEYGLFIDRFLYQRGLMWFSDDDFRNGASKELEEVNEGNRIHWVADEGYSAT